MDTLAQHQPASICSGGNGGGEVHRERVTRVVMEAFRAVAAVVLVLVLQRRH